MRLTGAPATADALVSFTAKGEWTKGRASMGLDMYLYAYVGEREVRT